jgi:hypothetical protein
MRFILNRPVLLLSCLLIALPFAGFCATMTIGPNKEVLLNGKPFFPIMTWLQNPSLIATEKTYGINTFVGQGDNSSALAYCNAAQAQGVYAVTSWNAAEAASVKTHPAMVGWVFGDEPDLQGNKVPPSVIRVQYDSIKAADPNHIAFLTTTSGFYSGDGLPAWMNGSDTMYYSYPKYTDLIGFDYYPVYGWCRPDWIYKVGESQSELAAKYCKGVKSTYQWIECVKTSGQWCDIAARGANDGPYAYEIADQVWLAIINGANAIGYFTHSWECPGYSQCCVSDSQIAMLKQVNARITALTGPLCAADSKIAVTVQTTDAKGKISFLAKEFGGSLYLFAASVINLAGARDTQQATITVPGLQGAVTVYDENRTITPTNLSFSDKFIKTDPAHIYVVNAGLAVGFDKAKNAASAFSRPRYAGHGPAVNFFVPPEFSQEVKMFSCSGVLLRTLAVSAGSAAWNCTDDKGTRLGAGVYYAAVSGFAGTSVISVLLQR